jgi:peptide chain release factor subunit 1
MGMGRELRAQTIVNPKTRGRRGQRGWMQMRYQRHVDHRHLKHAKEAAAALTRVVREERIESVVLGGDDVILPLVREELPPEIQDKVIGALPLNVRTPEHVLIEATLEAFRRHDAATDVDAVFRLLEEYRSGGLAVVGLEDTVAALESGQVDQLLLVAAPIGLDRTGDPEFQSAGSVTPAQLADRENMAGDLVARARRTGASIRFIEDADLLWEIGGVGAFLRYRVSREAPAALPPEVLPVEL